jgi:hypothetical protein
MAQNKRSSASITNKRDIGAGPYLAKIISHLDPSFMGSLEVTLLRDQGNTIGEDTQTYIVKCAQPFYGYTAFENMGQNTATDGKVPTIEAYNDTQKSYGMWFVPPDVGVTVLVVFVDGDPSQGYWIGCIPSRFTNNMVPGIAGSTNVDMDKADKDKYNTKQPLPIAELNRRLNKRDQNLDIDNAKRPLHPIAERFLEQGLLEDDVRGVTTSSARRNTPSMVFGISTPGPLDKRPQAKKARLGTANSQTIGTVPVSRLGGTQFVMDDGDDRYQRTTPAGGPNGGPVKYADVLAGEKGDPTIPYSEYFRIRTRTGHQLLMHNSEDLIYIGNAKGTTWVELTSNGKIDIYAADSISIHTENDLNIKAARDINMEAGRNINMKTLSGQMHVETATNFEVFANANGKITIGKNLDILVGSDTKISQVGTFDLNSGGDNRLSTSGNTSIGSAGDHKETAATINMNSDLPADPAVNADFVKPLILHANPATSSARDWASTKYQSGTTNSIMKRIPMHEPWPLHENQAPNLLTPDDTDRDA